MSPPLHPKLHYYQIILSSDVNTQSVDGTEDTKKKKKKKKSDRHHKTSHRETT